MKNLKLLFVLAFSSVVVACGGGGGGSTNNPPPVTPTPPPPTPTTPQWQAGVFAPASDFIAQCQTPRSGVDLNGQAFPDTQGTQFDEKMWLRSWSNETYLWYDEIDDVNPDNFNSPQEYFDVLITTERTASGAAKDNFHFLQSTEEYQSFAQSGVSTDYGIEWVFLRSSPPRDIRVSLVQPNSSAALAGVQRGDKLIDIDGESAIDGSNVDFLNAALFPSEIGENYQFTFERTDSSELVASLDSQSLVTTFVNDVTTIETAAGRVGYMRFDGFQRPAQANLIAGFQRFVDENVTDLVLDLRYNGGGLLAMSSQLAYMIAGPAQTNGRTFELLRFNDKNPNRNPVTGDTISPTPFYNREINWTTSQFTDRILPSLSLTRVFVITTADTCSASEALINGLRGVDVEVIQIGDRTCGKPYGFYPTDNCGTTYFTIQFQGVNDKGFGDYADGFVPVSSPVFDDQLPGCTVADNFTQLLGTQEEDMLAAALQRLVDGDCPVVPSEKPSRNQSDKGPLDMMAPQLRMMLEQNKIYTDLQTSTE